MIKSTVCGGFFLVMTIVVAHYFPTWLPAAIITGVFIFVTAITVAFFAIDKIQKEQRTLRLQKVYFEDAFLGQANSIENMMSQTNKNMHLSENLLNLTLNLLKQKNIQIAVIKNYGSMKNRVGNQTLICRTKNKSY